MANLHSNLLLISVNGAAVAAVATNVDLNRGTATQDTTPLSSGSERNDPTLTNWTCAVDLMIVVNDAAWAALKAKWRAKQKVSVAYTEDGVTETGTATITEITSTGKSGQYVTGKVSLKGDGDLTV